VRARVLATVALFLFALFFLEDCDGLAADAAEVGRFLVDFTRDFADAARFADPARFSAALVLLFAVLRFFAIRISSSHPDLTNWRPAASRSRRTRQSDSPDRIQPDHIPAFTLQGSD
jgi:hypothetical protein